MISRFWASEVGADGHGNDSKEKASATPCTPPARTELRPQAFEQKLETHSDL